MTDPITPPTELLQRLCDAAFLRGADGVSRGEIEVSLILEAFAAGADQELEACCEWTQGYAKCGDALRLARRPKPPSLKEQALEAAQRFYAKGHEGCTDKEVKDDFDAIRRALEALDD